MAQIGVTMFSTDYSMPPSDLARAVEERGLDSMFFPEHTHIPTSRRTPWPGGGDLPKEYWHTNDPFVALAAAAAVTKRIKLATGICLVMQRDPIILAKELASLDLLSGGRVIFGIGGGWNVEEMASHGTAFKTRWKVVRERILAMREIWTKETAEFHGEFVNFDPLWSYPKPVQPGGPPVMLGSVAKRCFERVVDYCDGWMPINMPGYDLSGGIGKLREAADRAGRSFDSLKLVLFGLGPSEDHAKKCIDMGFEHLVFWLPPAGSDKVLPMLDSYADLAGKLR